MDEPFSHRVLFGVSLFSFIVLPGLVSSLQISSNLYWSSYRCNRSTTYLWTRFNLYTDVIFLVTWSLASSSILPPHAIFPQIQGPVPQCTSVRHSWKLRWSTHTDHVSLSSMLGAMSWLPPLVHHSHRLHKQTLYWRYIHSATPISYTSWVIFGLIFNYWIRRRWGGWWRQYNYVTAAALDTGLILSTIVIFFAITFPGVAVPNWWGNTAPFETMVSAIWLFILKGVILILMQQDSLYTAIRKTVSGGETFGPATW